MATSLENLVRRGDHPFYFGKTVEGWRIWEKRYGADGEWRELVSVHKYKRDMDREMRKLVASWKKQKLESARKSRLEHEEYEYKEYLRLKKKFEPQ